MIQILTIFIKGFFFCVLCGDVIQYVYSKWRTERMESGFPAPSPIGLPPLSLDPNPRIAAFFLDPGLPFGFDLPLHMSIDAISAQT